MPDTGMVTGRVVEPGVVSGEVFALSAALSFWGGYDAERGVVIESTHPDRGSSLAGRVVLLARTKGSSSSASVLAEAVRNRTAPAALVMREPDLILALGAIVARELYGVSMPIVVLGEAEWAALPRTGRVAVRADADDAHISWPAER